MIISSAPRSALESKADCFYRVLLQVGDTGLCAEIAEQKLCCGEVDAIKKQESGREGVGEVCLKLVLNFIEEAKAPEKLHISPPQIFLHSFFHFPFEWEPIDSSKIVLRAKIFSVLSLELHSPLSHAGS